MLQRGLLTIAEQQQKQQQPQPPYETTRTATHEVNLLKEPEHLSNMSRSSNRQDLNESFKGKIKCLPIIEMPQIKIEQDVEYMEGIEEEQQLAEQEELSQDEERSEEQQNMEVEQEELSLNPVPQLLEPTSILKTSLLTGAANTLATLTAAAEQIARMPNDSLTKNYGYFKEENKRTYTVEEQEEQQPQTEKSESLTTSATATTTYTSILQTALMSKRPATLNVAATSTIALLSSSSSLASCSLAAAKTLHVRTPDQVLKTAVTLASLSEIAAQQEQQQQHQQQLLQSQQQQQPHILVVPQVQRKMCTLPFKKLNFANVTSSSSSSNSTTCTSSTASSNSTSYTSTTPTTTTAAATTTTITNNYLGSNLKTSTSLTNSSCILNTNNQAASISNSNRDKLETTPATFFDTNNIINNVTICSNSNNSNVILPFKSQPMATQTLKIPTIKPVLVTTQTQTEETATQTPLTTPLTLATCSTNNSASSLQTAGCSSGGLLRTAVPTNTKMLTQNSSNTHKLSNKYLTTTKLESNENIVADQVVGNIFKHVSNSSSTTLAKMNVTGAANEASNSANTATNVTVVVFETLLPED